MQGNRNHTYWQLSQKYRNKKDLYIFMSDVMVSKTFHSHNVFQQMFLPNFKSCPLGFLQDILTNSKTVYQRTDVKRFKIPLLPELGVANIWPEAIKLPMFANYMPNEWTSAKKVERNYFWGVLIVLAEDYVVQLVQDVRVQRNNRRLGGPAPPRQIQVTD